MPKITRYRPNRSHPRRYTKEDAARIVCYTLNAMAKGKNITEDPTLDGVNLNRQGGRSVGSVNFGGTIAFFDRDLQEVIARVEEKCGGKSSKPKNFQQAAAAAEAQLEEEGGITGGVSAIGAMEAAQGQIDENNITFSNILEWTAVIIGLLTTINAIAKFVPFAPLRLILSPLPLVIRRAAGFQGAILARKAANDRNWVQLRRAIELLKAA